MILSSRPGMSLIPVSLAAVLTGCQSTALTVQQAGRQQPIVQVQHSVEDIADPWAQRPAIRPGHSFDVDHCGDAPALDRSFAERPADRVPRPASDPKVRLGYLVPPPPIPQRGNEGSSIAAGSRKSIESAPPIRPLAQKQISSPQDQKVTAQEPPSPAVASPFSLRGFYHKLRGHKNDGEGSRNGAQTATPASVCEFHESEFGTSPPVALGSPEPDPESSRPPIGQQSSTVMQACPSCFQRPMWAEPPVKGTAN